MPNTLPLQEVVFHGMQENETVMISREELVQLMNEENSGTIIK